MDMYKGYKDVYIIYVNTENNPNIKELENKL